MRWISGQLLAWCESLAAHALSVGYNLGWLTDWVEGYMDEVRSRVTRLK